MEELCCLLDTPGLRISYDETNGWLYNQWQGRHDEASIRVGAREVYACLAAVRCTRILSDHSEVVGGWDGATAWVWRHHFDRLAACGVTRFAWVYAPGYPDRTAMEKALYFTAYPVVGIFNDLASAYDWLRQ